MQDNSNTTKGDEEKKSFSPKARDIFVHLSSIIDNANTPYQVEWQRVGNMQQSAGALVAALAIVFSGVLGFVLLPSDSQVFQNSIYANTVILPLVLFDFVFLVLSMIFFFIVIWPTKIKALSSPTELLKSVQELELWKALTKMIAIANTSIIGIHQHVEKKQRFYRKALIACSTALAGTILLVLIVLTKLPWVDSFKLAWWFGLSIIALTILFIMFLKNGGQK